MIALAVAIGVCAAGLVGFVFGRSAGGRRVWQEMLSDRMLGHLALERLGKAHGAKIELVELP